MKLVLAIAVALLAFATDTGWAQPVADQPTPEQAAEMRRLIVLRDSLKPQHGVVKLAGPKATLQLGDKYYFLPAADARRVLTEGWGNPPEGSEDVLGMIFPAGKTFLDETWGAVVRYEETAYVSDTKVDAAEYDDLMASIQEGAIKSNPEREKAGYPPLRIVGWAQPPSYDPKHHDLIWAQELQFGAEQDHTLNYDVRHLGRHGVLSLNMISQVSSTAEVRRAAVELASTAEFDEGLRYADYQEGDKKAGYGLAGLVAAGVGVGVAKKAGLLAVALIFLKKGAVFIAAGAAGAVAWARNFFKKKDL